MQASEPTRHETYQHVTVRDAAEELGVSVATIRRMIRDGRLEGERVIRPQGTAFLVRLPIEASTSHAEASSTDQAARVMTRDNASSADMMMAAWSRAVVEPLTRLIEDQQRQLNERAETIGRQAERLSVLEDRLRMLEAPELQEGPSASNLTAQGPEPTEGVPSEPPEPLAPDPLLPTTDGRQPWWRRCMDWLAAS